jgi:hypothetical protein
MHALQTIYGLLFNRAQISKVPIMNYGSSLGYRPTPTGADVLRLMKDVRIFSFLMNIFTEQPVLPTSPLLLQQVLDGLLRMVHYLPDHVRTDLHTSLQIFAARFKLKQTILPMALLISVAAIVQPPLQLDHGVPSFSDSTSPATDLSDVRQITDGCVQQLPVATATAMVARQYPSDRKRVSVPVSLNAGARRDDRTDSGRRDPRPDPDRRPASASTTITLEDIQKTMANLQSQVDRHTRLTRRDDDARPPRATAYYLRPTGPPADPASSDEDPIATHRAFCFDSKANTATRQDRRASLGIHGPYRTA